MSEAKFTKGEWGILPIEEDKEYIRIRGTVLGGSYKIANVIDLKEHHSNDKWCELEREESLANAHLIAAAPEMYEMLESLCEQDECQMFKYHIKKLLAKARGEK